MGTSVTPVVGVDSGLKDDKNDLTVRILTSVGHGSSGR